MNSKDEKITSGGPEAARQYELSPNIAGNKLNYEDSDPSGMKRAAAKKLIERYYYQLKDGCGNSSCTNMYCASNSKANCMTPNEAAAQALKLFNQRAKLCEPNPAKIAKLPTSPSDVQISESSTSNLNKESTLNTLENVKISLKSRSSNENFPSTSSADNSKNVANNSFYLTEAKLIEIINTCVASNNYSLLIRTLGEVYSKSEYLNRSFIKQRNGTETRAETLTKEDLRAMEDDQDKDEDSKETNDTNDNWKLKPDEVTVDVASLRRAYTALFQIPGLPFQGALSNALLILSENAEMDLKYLKTFEQDPNYINMFIIVMEIPALHLQDFTSVALVPVCKAAAHLPLAAQAKLVRFWSKFSSERLKEMVGTLHQVITEHVINSNDHCINENVAVIAATKLMKLLFYASIFGGELDCESVIAEETELNDAEENLQDLLQGAVGRESKEPKQVKVDLLAQELGVRIVDCREPLIAFEDFYNEPLSDQIEMHKDIVCYKDSDVNKFSFMNYGFILTPATRAMALYYDNRIRMYSERRISVLQSFVHGTPSNPYLKLRVRRDHIIDDALVELEMIAMENPNDLKKQLVVEFLGEQGIDEGGVSKEFFQLVVEEIFNPDFAMFTLNADTQMYWFNPTSFESDAQFTLIGIVLGLAIYNNVILDVHFPLVVYRKLLGKIGGFSDLIDWDPNLAQGLTQLLQYEGDDLEDVFGLSFRIGYTDIFGVNLTYDLKENGSQIFVNQQNKQEFIDLYADFLLNKSIEKQFRAFRRGFQMVTEESPLKALFRPEDVELLVCGNKNFDFNALEEATEYDNGYNTDSPVIRYFWEIVHELSLEQKRKLLQFTTGSDRVPVGGLSKLKLIISRNGPDSDRLPTAHTCFNILLLPEYSSKEKLGDRLLKAITYSKGFGML
uniref:Ubiquitin-protein ligase E3A n=1 Tax=Strigamia maritima TaxID=126957 RepID=T1IQC0_STRMM